MPILFVGKEHSWTKMLTEWRLLMSLVMLIDGHMHQPSVDYVLNMEVTQYKTHIERLVKEKAALEVENAELKSKVLELEGVIQRGGYRQQQQQQHAPPVRDDDDDMPLVSHQPAPKRRRPSKAQQQRQRAQQQQQQQHQRSPEPARPPPASEHDRGRVTDLLSQMIQDCPEKLEGIIPIIEVMKGKTFDIGF